MARGRLGNTSIFNNKLSDNTTPCRISAQLEEGGNVTISVTATGEYVSGSVVSASIETNEIPKNILALVQKALEAVLNEVHDDIKEEFQRERANAIHIASNTPSVQL